MQRRNFIQLTSSTLLLSLFDNMHSGNPPQSSSLTIYAHKDFGGPPKTIDVDSKVLNQVYAIRSDEYAGEISSMRWNLRDSKRIILYSEREGMGRQYSLIGRDENLNMSNNSFNDCALSYRVILNNTVPQYFDDISPTPRTITLENRRFREGTDGGWWSDEQEHFQGIQVIDDNHIIITTSDFIGAYFFIMRWDGGITSGQPGRFCSEVFIKNDFPEMTYNHCSGIQMLGTTVAIGLEYIGGGTESGKPQSSIVFYDLSEPRRPRKIDKIITRQSKTAGTAGLTFTRDNRILLVVGGRGAQDLDFYLSSRNNQNGVTAATQFNTPLHWRADGAGTRGWVDDRWAADYESINLICDFNGDNYLVGFNRTFVSYNRFEDWADLYTVKFNNNQITLKKIAKKKCSTNNGVRFNFASGLHTPTRKINFIAAGDGRTSKDFITLNYYS